MSRLVNKVAIVTGGGSGIGKAVVKRFREEGAAVCVFDVNGGGEDFFEVNVAKEEEILSAVEKIVEKYGKIDILVNNAGTLGACLPTHLMDGALWDRTFEVDVKGVMLCTKAVLPYMIKRREGSIVNLSSVYGTHGAKDEMSDYHAAKGAVLALTRQDAATYGEYNVRVNAVLPGAIVTPLLRRLGERFPGGFAAYEKYVSRHTPLGRLGEPEDIAGGVLFLASDEAKFITGAWVCIDGGYTVK